MTLLQVAILVQLPLRVDSPLRRCGLENPGMPRIASWHGSRCGRIGKVAAVPSRLCARNPAAVAPVSFRNLWREEVGTESSPIDDSITRFQGANLWRVSPPLKNLMWTLAE